MPPGMPINRRDVHRCCSMQTGQSHLVQRPVAALCGVAVPGALRRLGHARPIDPQLSVVCRQPALSMYGLDRELQRSGSCAQITLHCNESDQGFTMIAEDNVPWHLSQTTPSVGCLQLTYSKRHLFVTQLVTWRLSAL